MKSVIKNNAFKLDNMIDLLNILDVDHVCDSEQYMFNGYIVSIIDELEYNGITLNTLLKNITVDGFGYSFWDLYYIKNEDEYYLINNFV